MFWRWLKRLFKKERVYTSHGEAGKDFKAKWGIIIPHTSKAPGCYSKVKKISEYNYALKMCVHLIQFPFETRDNGGVYGAASRLKKKGVNASLEPHKNAFNEKAKGFEILFLKGDKQSEKMAQLIAEEFKRHFPNRILRRNQGLFPVSRGDRGHRNLLAAKDAGMVVALLSESFFLDNPLEWIEPEQMAKFWEEVLV